MPEIKTLNLGCGDAKITGAVNVDVNPSVEPDLCFDLVRPFPLEDNSFNEVYFFHCIEHLKKGQHTFVLSEIHRILAAGGILYISFPEFEKIARNWIDNTGHRRRFWEATIFGRQMYEGDYHYSAINSLELREQLFDCGFNVIKVFPEPTQDFNTVIWAEKIEKPKTYEELLYREIFES